MMMVSASSNPRRFCFIRKREDRSHSVYRIGYVCVYDDIESVTMKTMIRWCLVIIMKSLLETPYMKFSKPLVGLSYRSTDLISTI